MNQLPDHPQGPASRYRAYLIGEDGRIDRVAELPGDTDEEAGAHALQLVDGHAVELWDRSRKIARFEPLHS